MGDIQFAMRMFAKPAAVVVVPLRALFNAPRKFNSSDSSTSVRRDGFAAD